MIDNEKIIVLEWKLVSSWQIYRRLYTRAAPCWRLTCVSIKDLAAVCEQLKHLQLAAVGGDHDVAVVFAQELHVQHLVVVADKLRGWGKLNVPTWIRWNILACVLSMPTCCSVARPASWYSIMLCSAVTVASLEEAGRRRRWVKLRGLSSFFSSSSPSSSSFFTETVLRVWLKTQRAVLGSHTLSMPLMKGARTLVTGKHTNTLPQISEVNLCCQQWWNAT